jgi:predicted permease
LRDRLQAATRNVARGSRARRTLVVAQVALTAVLLFAAGLLLATLRNVARIDLGFDPTPLAMASIELSPQGYDRARGLEFQRRLLEELAGDSAVEQAALGSQWPLQVAGMRHTLRPEGYVFAPGEDEGATYDPISPNYFAALAVPIVAGREFSAEDRAGGRPVAVVNQAFAERFFSSLRPEQVIGRRVDFGENDEVEIIGVSRDTKGRELRQAASPTIYVPLAQRYVSRVTVVARARPGQDSRVARSAIEQALTRLDRDLPSYGARTAVDQLRLAMARERALSTVLGGFSVVALVLSFAGIFGVLSFEVQARRRELGIRSALGAQGARLAGDVVDSALRLTVLGVVCAAVPAWLASRLLTAVLYEVSPGEPRAVLVVLTVVALATLAAAGGPALAAARVDPARLLRSD